MFYFIRKHGVLIIFILAFSYFFWVIYSIGNQSSKISYLREDIAKKNESIEEISSQISFLRNGGSIEREIKNKKKVYDLITDNSITKFVNPDVSFVDKEYVPENLEYIALEYVIDSKGNGQLRPIAKQYLEKMSEDFYKKFEKKIKVVSSYRSYKYQKGIKDRGCPDNLCAKAGHSEHQTGLAIDLWETTTNSEFMSKKHLIEYFQWLNKNAHKYGYHNTYQKGLEVDGYEIEPWHWRYLGVELATELKSKNMTLAEYYKKNKK